MINKMIKMKKTSLINNPLKKFRQTLTIKRNPINLKNSLENYNKFEISTDNNSNFNIKASAQSKLISDSYSNHVIQTQQNQNNKKSFFSDENRKFQEEQNQMSKTQYLNKSAKNKKIFQIDKIYNLKQNKFFFKNDNIKNEKVQCETDNNKKYYDFRNIMKKDKKIDRMAKQLILKLNEDEYYDRNKTFKNLFGNNITLRNGFFNGVNLVVNNQDDDKMEIQSLYNKINKDNIMQNNNNLTNSEINNNNFNKTQKLFRANNLSHLPLFLREKANIQGTEILSPFCKEARDEFLFNKIFNSAFNRKLPKRFELIDNKLNIFYAENENQYDEKLKKINNKLRLKGKRVVHEVGPTKDQVRLDKIKTTLSFIKKIFDYSYPNMVLSKVRKKGKYHDKRALTEMNIPPYKRAELLARKRNDILGKYLQMSINVKKS